MIQWLKNNRLKLVSALSVCGDFLMGLAGGVGLLNPKTETLGDSFLLAAGVVAVIGHSCILFWGRGSAGSQPHGLLTASAPFYARPFIPWRYPLDTGFSLFAMAGVCIALAGVTIPNPPFIAVGLFVSTASLIGWLWPQEKMIIGMPSVRMTALLYMCSTFSSFMAAFYGRNIIIFTAACSFLIANFILYTVRKEHQSSYTQSHG